MQQTVKPENSNTTINENLIRDYAIYSSDQSFKIATIREIIDLDSLERIGKGVQTRVFRTQDKKWVLKEGRWDLDMSLFKDIEIDLPAELAEGILRQFGFQFLPRDSEIRRQYDQYLVLAEYFGYFENDAVFHHPNRKSMFKDQKNIRKNLFKSLDSLKKKYKLDLPDSIDEIIDSEELKTNFLPKEYLIFADSFSPENKGKLTYYIIQEYCEGKLLHDYPNSNLPGNSNDQLILLAILMLKMANDKEMVPDMRPRFMAQEPIDWFSNTDNILVTDQGIKFIDTRLMWGVKDNIVKRGFIIPEMAMNSAKAFIKKTLDNYSANSL